MVDRTRGKAGVVIVLRSLGVNDSAKFSRFTGNIQSPLFALGVQSAAGHGLARREYIAFMYVFEMNVTEMTWGQL